MKCHQKETECWKEEVKLFDGPGLEWQHGSFVPPPRTKEEDPDLVISSPRRAAEGSPDGLVSK